MKTENKNMRIVKRENEEEPKEQIAGKSPTPKQVKPVILESIPDDIVFIRSADVCKLLNISNSTLKNLRTAKIIPYYKLGGTFLYSKDEIMTYLANNYSRRI